MEVASDDTKYCKDFIVNIRQQFIVLRKLLTSYTNVTKTFPYCNDLHELLVAYVELEILVYSKSPSDSINQNRVENMIIQTLRYMLFDSAVVDGIKSVEDACTLRCLYTLKMVSLTIRFSYSLIENMARKLSVQLKYINLLEENKRISIEADNQPSNMSKVQVFFKKCHEIATARLYYFDEDDAAGPEKLQPVYKAASTSKRTTKFSCTKRPVRMAVGVVTDQEILSIMEYHRERYLPKFTFEYVKTRNANMDDSIIILDDESDNRGNETITRNANMDDSIIILDDESDNGDNETINVKRRKNNSESCSPICIDSDNEDVSSCIVENSSDESTNSVINSSFQSQKAAPSEHSIDGASSFVQYNATTTDTSSLHTDEDQQISQSPNENILVVQ